MTTYIPGNGPSDSGAAIDRIASFAAVKDGTHPAVLANGFLKSSTVVSYSGPYRTGGNTNRQVGMTDYVYLPCNAEIQGNLTVGGVLTSNVVSTTAVLDWINVVNTYNADPTGVADSTSAFQAAINAAQAKSASMAVSGTNNVLNLAPVVYVPFGNYLISSPFTFIANRPIRFTGAAGARIFSNASGIIDFGGNVINNLEIDHLTLDATGGHIFVNANLKFSYLHHLQLLQRSPAFGIWSQTQAGNSMQNCSFEDIIYYVLPDPATNLRTVPAWKIYCDTGASFAETQFSRMTGFNLANAAGNRDTSQYLFDLACTAQTTSSYITQLAFRDCSFHRCLGGAIKAQSSVGLLIDHITIQDVYNGAGGTGINLAASIINIGTYGTGPASRAPWIKNYHRGNTAATGAGVDPSDLTVSADTIAPRVDGFIMTQTPANDKPQINLNGAAQAFIQGADSLATILNQAADTIVIGSGAIKVGGTAITVP